MKPAFKYIGDGRIDLGGKVFQFAVEIENIVNMHKLAECFNLAYEIGRRDMAEEIHAKSEKMMDKFGI